MNIPLHPKYGVNPSMTTCFYCGESKEIILVGSRTRQFKEAGLASESGEMPPSVGCIDKIPCAKCEELMKQGTILISVKDGEDGDNPYRTGGWVVIKDEAIRGMIRPTALAEDIIRTRIAFVPDQAWDAMGLPRGEDNNDE